MTAPKNDPKNDPKNEPQITPELVAAHGLKPDEYERILKLIGRVPTFTELGIFSAMWNEHCSYKSSRIHLRGLPTKAPWVIQGPGENAGVIDIGDGQAVVFKMESHNHPSYIEPYQGATTGVGGILRDVFTMGARPIACLNALSFGAPEHPKTRHLVSGVVAGVGGYGNSFGVPTVGGQVRFLLDDADLGVELQRVVGADLGAEAVFERGDNAPAVGVILRVGGGHHEDVERQAQHVAADLDVRFLHDVEHGHLDALGQVRQLVDGHDAAVRARDEAVVDGLRVAEAAALAGQTPDIRALTRDAPIIPETVDARDVVAILRDSAVHIGLVHDEYGTFQGVVTSADILEAIVGAFHTEEGPAEPAYVKRDDGSYLISGWMPALEFSELLGIALPSPRPYQTAAGFLLHAFGAIPDTGAKIAAQGWDFEIVDLDGRRIDKVLASKRPVA